MLAGVLDSQRFLLKIILQLCIKVVSHERKTLVKKMLKKEKLWKNRKVSRKVPVTKYFFIEVATLLKNKNLALILSGELWIVASVTL